MTASKPSTYRVSPWGSDYQDQYLQAQSPDHARALYSAGLAEMARETMPHESIWLVEFVK
jgi:hypothetical protein